MTAPDRGNGESEHFRPVGTIALLSVLAVLLVLLWLSVYLVMISRGPTG